MLVKQIVYFLSIFIFLTSIIALIYSIANKKKIVCKYIIVLSIIYMLFFILGIYLIPYYLNLETGFEILFYNALLFVSIIIFMITIVISNRKLKKLKDIIQDVKKSKLIILFLIILPIIIFSISYFREVYYINNSKLILVCTSGDNFNEKTLAYAINDNYCEEISIGTDFRGYKMARHLPKDFNEFIYSWSTDEININNNKIVIYRNNELVYEGKSTHTLPTYALRAVFYK